MIYHFADWSAQRKSSQDRGVFADNVETPRSPYNYHRPNFIPTREQRRSHFIKKAPTVVGALWLYRVKLIYIPWTHRYDIRVIWFERTLHNWTYLELSEADTVPSIQVTMFISDSYGIYKPNNKILTWFSRTNYTTKLYSRSHRGLPIKPIYWTNYPR